MTDVWDAVIVGGGPAGAATAIRLAEAGRSCLLLERATFPRERPGETLHPGVEALLRQIDVWQEASALSVVRPLGIRVSTPTGTRLDAFGEDADGPWRGLQIRRADLDALLVEQATCCGVVVAQQQVRGLTVSGGRVCGVVTGAGTITARVVIDAAGGQHLLARLLQLHVERCSPTLLVAYGYVDGVVPVARRDPHFAFDRRGWTWVARVGRHLTQWTRLDVWPAVGCAPRRRAEKPMEVEALPPIGRTRGADVTWRRVSAPAGRGYFIVGDAAAVIDPASSDGVLRGLLSGRLAGHLAAHVLAGTIPEDAALAAYGEWMRDLFARRVSMLDALYSDVFSDWREARAAIGTEPASR